MFALIGFLLASLGVFAAPAATTSTTSTSGTSACSGPTCGVTPDNPGGIVKVGSGGSSP